MKEPKQKKIPSRELRGAVIDAAKRFTARSFDGTEEELSVLGLALVDATNRLVAREAKRGK